jgi:hypothetical protein
LSSKDQHKEKAEHNKFLRDELDNPFWDWAVTATFYAAVQCVEAYFATIPLHSKNHEDRDSSIQRDAKIRSIYGDYRLLKDESRDARYQPYITFAQADVQRVQTYLQTVKNVILPLI